MCNAMCVRASVYAHGLLRVYASVCGFLCVCSCEYVRVGSVETGNGMRPNGSAELLLMSRVLLRAQRFWPEYANFLRYSYVSRA